MASLTFKAESLDIHTTVSTAFHRLALNSKQRVWTCIQISTAIQSRGSHSVLKECLFIWTKTAVSLKEFMQLTAARIQHWDTTDILILKLLNGYMKQCALASEWKWIAFVTPEIFPVGFWRTLYPGLKESAITMYDIISVILYHQCFFFFFFFSSTHSDT